MNNFKIGDVVERLDADFLRSVGPGPHVVTGVGYCGWLQINHWRDRSGNEYPWSQQFFTLVDGGDDELPPAPEEVRYTTLQYDWQDKYNDQHLTASTDTFTDNVCIHIQGSTTSQRNKDMALSVLLNPDEILQLCHDLRRMAMSIKRKEKQV